LSSFQLGSATAGIAPAGAAERGRRPARRYRGERISMNFIFE
jgi:hypothetical protein